MSLEEEISHTLMEQIDRAIIEDARKRLRTTMPNLDKPFLLLTEAEYTRGYYTWNGLVQRHCEYELVQTFGDGESKKFLVNRPIIREQPSKLSVEV